MLYRYAHQKNSSRNNGDPYWTPLTYPELKAYLAIHIIMGVKILPTVNAYWNTNPALGCPWISSTMSKNLNIILISAIPNLQQCIQRKQKKKV